MAYVFVQLNILEHFVDLVSIYLIIFNQTPNYWLYITYVYDYLNPSSYIGNIFSLVDDNFYTLYSIWIFMAVMHVVTVFYMIKARFSLEKSESDVNRIYVFNVFCVIAVSYAVSRSFVVSLMNYGFPSILLMLTILLREKEHSKCPAFVVSASVILCIISLTFFSNIAKAFHSGSGSLYKGGDILYAAVHNKMFSIERFFYNLTHFCSRKVVNIGAGSNLSFSEENTCKRNGYHKELRDAVEKWYSKEKNTLLFHRDFVEIMMETGKVHQFLSNSSTDSI